MLCFLWVFGGDCHGGPDDVPALLADSANTDDELLRTLTGGVLGSAPEAPQARPEGPGPCDAADLRGRLRDHTVSA